MVLLVPSLLNVPVLLICICESALCCHVWREFIRREAAEFQNIRLNLKSICCLCKGDIVLNSRLHSYLKYVSALDLSMPLSIFAEKQNGRMFGFY